MEPVNRSLINPSQDPRELPEPPEAQGVVAVAERKDPTLAYASKSLAELFDMAMAGEIPRARELKQGEPERLKPQHLNILLLRSMNMSPGDIAAREGLSNSRVSVILGHPDSQFIMARMMGLKAGGALGEVSERIRDLGHEMVDIAVYHARNVKRAEVSRGAAFDLLKMGGFGAVQKLEVQNTVTIAPGEATFLATTLQESQRAREIQGARYTVVASTGGGNPSAASEL